METLLEGLKRVIKKEGKYKTITEFLNNWITEGKTFVDLRDWLEIEHGISKNTTTVWKTLRQYLTIPYDYEDQFWYKWNSIAKAKGFKNAGHMVHIFRKRKLCLEDMALELGLKPKGTNKVIQRLSKQRINGQIVPKRKYVRKHFKMSRDRDGITQKNRREIWRVKLAKYGFRSLRDAIWRLRKRGYTYIEMAQLLETTVRDLRYRRRRAGL